MERRFSNVEKVFELWHLFTLGQGGLISYFKKRGTFLCSFLNKHRKECFSFFLNLGINNDLFFSTHSEKCIGTEVRKKLKSIPVSSTYG